MFVRRISAGLAVLVGVLGLTVGGVGGARADSLPQFAPFGTTLFTFGDANFCTGAIAVSVEGAAGAPGHVLAHVTPLGYQRGPCGNNVQMQWVGSAGGNGRVVYVHAGEGPGETVTTDLWVGMGLGKIIVNTWPLQGPFIEWYFWVL